MRVVLLGVKNDPTLKVLYNHLKSTHSIAAVFTENKEPLSIFLKRRIKKLGIFRVASQVLFKVMIIPILQRKSKSRILELEKKFHFDYSEIPPSLVVKVENINSPESIQSILDNRPDLILVNGTRILSKSLINSLSLTILNTHVGITPLYRGVHGGYWALANNDSRHCGVTVHLIDTGIDTGGIVYQSLIKPKKNDNFLTYPYHQQFEGLKLLIQAIQDVEKRKLKTIPAPEGESKLWYHPGFFEYVWNGVSKGVW